MRNTNLSGQVAIVTGASKGIGAAIAKQLAAAFIGSQLTVIAVFLWLGYRDVKGVRNAPEIQKRAGAMHAGNVAKS